MTLVEYFAIIPFRDISGSVDYGSDSRGISFINISNDCTSSLQQVSLDSVSEVCVNDGLIMIYVVVGLSVACTFLIIGLLASVTRRLKKQPNQASPGNTYELPRNEQTGGGVAVYDELNMK